MNIRILEYLPDLFQEKTFKGYRGLASHSSLVLCLRWSVGAAMPLKKALNVFLRRHLKPLQQKRMMSVEQDDFMHRAKFKGYWVYAIFAGAILYQERQIILNVRRMEELRLNRTPLTERERDPDQSVIMFRKPSAQR